METHAPGLKATPSSLEGEQVTMRAMDANSAWQGANSAWQGANSVWLGASRVTYSSPKLGEVAAGRRSVPVGSRDRWPFLNEPDCPAELLALVGHRISKYHEYSNLYPQLRDAKSVAELSTLCGKLLDAYLDNQQCFRELDYYAKHRRVQGKHPFLRNFKELSRLRSKTTKQLFEERKRTQDNIWRAKSEMAKGDKPHLDSERKQRIQQYEQKLLEINRLLGE